jgi:hypothetical protein
MAKKQRRYRMPALEQVFPELQGKTVSLILKGQQVFQVKVLAMEGQTLLAADGLQQEHRFALGLIEEVIVEMQA